MARHDKNNACPLCGFAVPISMAAVPTAPIAAYWYQYGYDVKTAFPDLPMELTKFRCPQCDLRFFLPRLVGGPDLYAALQRSDIYYGAWKWEFAEVLALLARGDRARTLLEFGCGRGNFLEQAAPYFARVRGMDFNDDALAECRKKGLDVGRFEASELDQHYDVVVSFQVMEHLADPGETVTKLAALVRGGGLLIVAVPNEDSPLGELESNYLNLPPHHFTRWTERTMRFLTNDNDLQLEQYIREPLSEMLYLALVNERISRYLSKKGLFARVLAAAVRRIAIASALTQFDSIRKRLAGHTHIAVYRKIGSSSA